VQRELTTEVTDPAVDMPTCSTAKHLTPVTGFS
jgi:hypothetical protein